MIKALMLDLGETLIDKNGVLPGVPEALTTLQTLKSADHKPLIMCLVSDFTMLEPRTPEAIDAAFKDYLKILDQVQLRAFFEPVEERVTLSTHAGVRKPDRRVFETALERAKVHASIEQSLFITENPDHVKACREMKMKALQFGVDFVDWKSAPLLVTQIVDASNLANITAALKPVLAAQDDIQLDSVESLSGSTVRGKGRGWVKLEAPELGPLNGVHVELPVTVEAKLEPSGQVANLRAVPLPDDVTEAVKYVQSLASNKQVRVGPSPAATSVLPTHGVETDARGRRLLRRRRFTAY